MTRAVEIRPARREEWGRVRDLRLRSLSDAPDAFGSTLEREREHGEAEWIEWVEGWEDATNVLYVAEDGDTWIGTAVGSRTGQEADAHLYGMWVDPAWRARGIGARLVDQVAVWARSWGARSLILAITETNAGAAAFFERLGFAVTGEGYPLREGSDLTTHVMHREP